MATASNQPSLRVRISADIEDMKQGMALMKGQVQALQNSAAKQLPAKNGVSDIGKAAKDSSRELAMVMPQITDIVTQLQGGTPFTTVLLQQGGQLRDVFGGVAPALGAVGRTLVSLINPATLTAAALGTVALAWYQADQAQTAYTKALALTGNAMGVTEADMVSMADAIASAQKVTTSAARAAVVQTVQTGAVAKENMQAVATAAVAMQELTGQAIDKTVADYAKLAKDPVAAVKAMNEQQHFLTLEVYEHIQALQDQGRYQEAASVATKAASDSTVEALSRVRAAQSPVARGFAEILRQASNWWNSAKSSFGMADRATEMQTLLGQNQADLATLKKGVSDGMGYGWAYQYESSIKTRAARIKELASQLAKEGADARIASAKDAAATTSMALDDIIDQSATKEEKKRKEVAAAAGRADEAIAAARAAGLIKEAETLEQKKRDALAAIEQKYAPKGTGAARASLSAGLQAFADAGDEEKARIDAQTKVLQAQYKARTISAAEYYAQLRQLTQQGTDAQAGALEKQIAYLKAHTAAGKEGITINKQIGTLEAKLASVREEGAAKVESLNEQEAALKKQREDAIRTYKDGLDQQTQALQTEMDAMVAHVGAGDREYEIRQRLAQIYAKQAGELKRLADARVQAGKDSEKLSTIDQQEADLRASTEQQVAALADGYERLAQAQGEWAKGAKAAWANYLEDVSNVAGSVQEMLTTAFKGSEDAFVQFVKTSKLSFSSLADSMIEDMARIAYRAAMSGLLGSITGGGGTSGSLLDLFSGDFMNFASGGYTGDGGKFDPAGIVHKGEGVVPQWGIAAMGGPAAFMGFLGTLRGGRGYAEGGMAGIAASAVSRSSSPNVQINIENNTGSQISAQAGDVKFDGEKWVIKIVANNIASGGAIAAAGKGRFGWKDQL